MLVFLVGMSPALDSIARHSIWLHSLQSALIHHVGPLLLVLACVTLPCHLTDKSPLLTRYLGSPLCAWTVLLSFAGMSWMWMLPELHLRLMEDADLYRMMKWGMAISGVLLCYVTSSLYLKAGNPTRYWVFSLGVALPQIAIGLFLIASPPLYPMPEHLLAHAPNTLQTWAMGLDASTDQIWGGMLLLSSALLFLAVDATRRYTRNSDFALAATT